MLKHLATPVRIVGTALVLIAVPCFAQTTKQSNGHATKNSKPIKPWDSAMLLPA